MERHDFGELLLYRFDDDSYLNVFESYRESAVAELQRLGAAGVADVPSYLYRIRNSLAHGRVDVLTHADGPAVVATVRALPLVKLLARSAVES